ncbi:hypothetical protein ACFQQB_24895 [Nonomuraea rubra]|uniref:hypothetical protein n=1 Tax=Nonomuraea rubra TaxID=46180 RepID=UPI00361DA014
MPRPGDLPMIVAVTAGLGLLIALSGIWLMWRLRTRSIGAMLAVVVVVAVTATLAGVVAIINKMIIEGATKDFVLSVVAVGGLVGLGVAFVLARRVVGESRRLVEAVRVAPFTAPVGCPPSCRRSRTPWRRRTRGSRPWRAPGASSSPG